MSRSSYIRLGAAVIAISALAASAASAASAAAAQKQHVKSQTLTVWEYYAVQSQTNVLIAQDKAFEAKNPGVKVNFVFVPFTEMDQKLVAAATAHTGPDAIIADGSAATQLVQAHVLANMTSCVRTWPTYKNLLPAKVSERVVNGRVYGVLPYGNLVTLWYNKTILDKYHLQPPKTISELQMDLAAVTKGGYGGLVLDGTSDFTGAWSSYGLFTALGVDYQNVSNANAVNAFKTLAGWGNRGWVPREVTTTDQPTAMDLFLTGKYAFTVNGNWEIQHARTDAKFKWGVTLMPRGSHPARVFISGETAMIGNYSKNQALACKYFGQTWFSPAGQLLTLKGIGSLPILKSLQNNPLLKGPVLHDFVLQAATAIPVPLGKLDIGLSTVWGPAISQMWSGNGNPASIEQAAAAKLKALGIG